MRRFLLLGVAAVLLAAAIAGVYVIRRDADTSTTVRADRAAELADAPAETPDVEPGLRPAAGTYTYRGSGGEDMSLLGGSTHTFPAEVFATVTLDEQEACVWRFNPVFIEEHVEHRTYCTTPKGAAEQAVERMTKFLGRKQTSSYECEGDGSRQLAAARIDSVSRWSCTEERGAIVNFTSTVVDHPTLTLDGNQVATTHLRIVGRQRNKGRGDETTEVWLLATGLPARITSTRSNVSSAGPLGTMHLNERYDYRLVSMQPER